MLALDPKRTWDYIPEADRDSGTPSTFEIRVLTKRERDYITEQQGKLTLVKWSYLAFRLVVNGWRDIYYRNDERELVELEYGTEEGNYPCNDRKDFVREDLIDLLPMEVWSECILATLRGNALDEEDRKN